MIKKAIPLMICACLALMSARAEEPPSNDDDTLFQVSTLGALQEGIYDGVMTLKELKPHGDFGIGTYDGLDGEMAELNGVFYQIRDDGKAYRVEEGVTTPFAVVTPFGADRKLEITGPADYKRLQESVLAQLPSKNIMYAVKISGNFSYVKTRSVPRQAKPYPGLAEVTKNQPTFEMKNVKGTILGYWLPAYLSGVNLAGFHFHFLTEDARRGGHLLEIQMTAGTAEIDDSYGLKLVLPARSDFFKAPLRAEGKTELEKIEK